MAKIAFVALTACAGASLRGLQATEATAQKVDPLMKGADKVTIKATPIKVENGVAQLTVTNGLTTKQQADLANKIGCVTSAGLDMAKIMPLPKNCLSFAPDTCKGGKYNTLKFVAGSGKDKAGSIQVSAWTKCDGKTAAPMPKTADAAPAPAPKRLLQDKTAPAVPSMGDGKVAVVQTALLVKGNTAAFTQTNMLSAAQGAKLNTQIGCLSAKGLETASFQNVPKSCLSYAPKNCDGKYQTMKYTGPSGDNKGTVTLTPYTACDGKTGTPAAEAPAAAPAAAAPAKEAPKKDDK